VRASKRVAVRLAAYTRSPISTEAMKLQLNNRTEVEFYLASNTLRAAEFSGATQSDG